jgi:hypothetical protein
VIPPKRSAPPVSDPLSDADPSSESDRPTVPAPFDPAAFARHSELKLQAVAQPPQTSTMGEARRLFDEGRPEEALFMLARLLEIAPLHAEANALSAECSAALERECMTAIGSPSAVLVVALSPGELKRFSLDHVSGFLLSLVDGRTDVETLLDLSGLSRLLALRHLRNLVLRGIIEVWQKKKV